jgi:hypothetical protein
MNKESIFYTFIALMVIFLAAPVARTQSAKDLKTSEDIVREEMLQLTKELGTTCTECHNVNNFKDSTKNSFRIGAKHIKLVAAMKANGFDGRNGPEANCYMCHRGQLKAPAKMPSK